MSTSIGSIYSNAASGLTSSAARFDATASKIAGFATGSTGTDDLVQNVVDLSTERVAFAASAMVLKSENQMLGTLLDVWDTPPRS